jgi:DNA repair protein RadC
MKRETTFTVRDLPREERPRERLLKLGSDALSSMELLALVIGRGVPGKSVMSIAQELLSKFGSVAAICEATVEELTAVKGLGPAKATQLKACFELGKRRELEPDRDRQEIKNPESIAKAVRHRVKDKAKEHFLLVILNTRNRITGVVTISVGTLNASLVHPREVFQKAIAHYASSVVLAHNHPSGDLDPSEEDLRITRRLVEAGKLLGIEVLDHIIITGKEHLSLKEKGLM